MKEITRGTILAETYEILEEIGSGGGGIVYRARHLRLETDVVVKKIRAEVVNKVDSRKEADILKKLKHPYLPRVYDFIETEDGVYTVMDFIQGENLEDIVKKNGRFPQKSVKKWAVQLGEALSYLHSQNPPIIHSDIKPANIMLTREGNVCLIDFNIALALGNTMESAVGISARYSPPEQYKDPALYERITRSYTLNREMSRDQKADIAEDEEATALLPQSTDEDKTALLAQSTDEDKTVLLPANQNAGQKSAVKITDSRYAQYIGKGIDARSDIYSLGVTLYYLLTGVEPAIEFDQRIPIEETKAVLSEGFALIVNKMMELSPECRYQNGGEYLNAVRNCHKLDARYRKMRRVQNGLQVAVLGSMALGIVSIFFGITLVKKETDDRYYTWLMQAETAIESSAYEEAAACIAEAKETLPLQITAYKDEIYLLYMQGAYKECIAQGEHLINAQPFVLETEADQQMFGDIYYLVGNAYYEQEDYVNSGRALQYALEYNAENDLYYRDYAIVLAKLGKIEEAEKQLNKAIDMGIARDSLSMVQGEIFHVKGDNEKALSSFYNTIVITDDIQMKKRAVLLCTDVYKSIGNEVIDEEIALLEENRDEFDRNGNMVLTEYLADAYVRKAQADTENTEIYYEKALSLFGEIYESGYVTYQMQENMAILYENLDEFDKAEEILSEMAETYPTKYEVYKRLAYLEADRQQMKDNVDRDYRQMKKYYEQVKELYSEDVQDMEMHMLEQMMQELDAGGWF